MTKETVVVKTETVTIESKFGIGHRVEKTGGDYSFEGNVVSVFKKRSGVVRLVVEDDRGLLFIFNENSLKLVPQAENDATT